MEGKETSAIFFLKNRDADNWADRIQTEHNLNPKSSQHLHFRGVRGGKKRVKIEKKLILS